MLVKHTKHLCIAGSKLLAKRTILALFLVCPSPAHNPLQGPIESDLTQRTSETPGANSYGLPLWQGCNILDAREGCKL
jgi:hypothetical protein